MPAIRLDHGAADREIEQALRRAETPWCAGFLLFGGEREQVARLTARLREAAGRPLAIASDMERGAGQQVRGLTTLPELGIWGNVATPDEVFAFGHVTAQEALEVGVDVLFAPVLDVSSELANPIVGHRAFGWDPLRVATLGEAFCRGVRAAGALPVGKHYPGHGATRLDSHTDLPVVHDPAPRLMERDLHPFRRVLAAGVCPAVMTAHVSYPALDASGAIATFSPKILHELRQLAAPHPVLVFTDALCMEGARQGIGTAQAARRALAAGCDVLLYAGDEENVARALADVSDEEATGPSERWAAWRRDAARSGETPAQDVEALVRGVAERAVARDFRGGRATGPVLVLEDDGLAERGEILAAAAAASGILLRRHDLARDGTPGAEALEAAHVIVLFASVQASKGPAGLSAAAHGALSRWGQLGVRPRLVVLGACVPQADVYVPGTHPAVEAALAHRLLPPRASLHTAVAP